MVLYDTFKNSNKTFDGYQNTKSRSSVCDFSDLLSHLFFFRRLVNVIPWKLSWFFPLCHQNFKLWSWLASLQKSWVGEEVLNLRNGDILYCTLAIILFEVSLEVKRSWNWMVSDAVKLKLKIEFWAFDAQIFLGEPSNQLFWK